MSAALSLPRAKSSLCVPQADGEGRFLCFPLIQEEKFQGLKFDPAYKLRLPIYGFFDTDQPPLITGIASWSTMADGSWFEWAGTNIGQPVRLNPSRLFSRSQRMLSRWLVVVPLLALLIAVISAVVLYFAVPRAVLLGHAQVPLWAAIAVSVVLGVAGLGSLIMATSVHSTRTLAVWANLSSLPPFLPDLVKKYRPSYNKLYIVSEMRGRWMVTETKTTHHLKKIDREKLVEEERKRGRCLAPVDENHEPESPSAPLRGMLVGAKLDPEFGTERLCVIRKFEF